jgi:hypothetical protein
MNLEVFQSKEMTVALLDRLTNRGEVILMTGKSKRHEERHDKPKAPQPDAEERLVKA